MAAPAPPSAPKLRVKDALEQLLFRARWLMAPFYVGLAVALAGLLVVFVREAVHDAAQVLTMTPEHGILMALSLIDLSLAGNLLLIVIFSGYENFVSRIDVGEHEDRPDWMGKVDFTGLKMKLIASIVAISAIALLRALMQLAEGDPIPDRTLAWLAGVHVVFVASGLLLALMDYVAGRAAKH